MKILNIANVAGIKRGGGVHEVAYNFWKIQNELGLSSDLWFPGFKHEEDDLARCSGFASVKALDTYGDPSFGLLRQHSAHLVKMEEYSIIHQHGIWLPLSKLSLEASKKHKRIVVIQPHGYLEPYRLEMSTIKKKVAYSLFEKRNLEQAKVLVACSIKEYSNLRKMFPKKDIAIIPNGISQDFYSRETEKNYFKKDEYLGKKNMLFLSRIHPLKGLVRLLKAYACIDNEVRNNWNIIIAGIDQDNHVEELKELVRELNLTDNVYFEGEKFNSEKVDIMSSANLFVLPTHDENYGIVVAESLARGVPVLTTKGAPWSLLEKEKCGFWVDNNDSGIRNGLKKAMLMSEADLHLMGKRGRSIAKQHFMWDGIVQKTIELHKWLLGEVEKPNFVFCGDIEKKNENIFVTVKLYK